MTRWSRSVGVLAGLLVVAAACAGGDDTSSGSGRGGEASTTSTTEGGEVVTQPYAGHESALYGAGENWLCRPAQDDVCDESLDATVVNADGSIDIQVHEVAEDAPVDCFYVYPTVSGDPGDNADLETDGDEERAVVNQAARLSSHCRLFAPVYRQITLNGLGRGAFRDEEVQDLAYDDVVDAWKQYVAADNDGRGVVLVGHSQGSGHLRRLISEEIDGVPELQDRLVSALLLGTEVAVPDGEDVGGSFAEIPACTEDGQAGCVVSYATFRATDPPPPTSFFGKVDGPDRALCTNPAALSGGAGALTPYFPSDSAEAFSAAADEVPEIETNFVTYPDLLSAECVRDGDFDYLELTIAADPSDPRTDDIGGDLTPEWGLHVVDANVAMGDLVEVVAAQIETYRGA